MLTPRKLAILQAVIDEYILTGLPIGSRTISKRNDMNVSSATIRNEMADLEDDGFLVQPHTSAGRIPSDKAYRLYVNMLMHTIDLDENERNSIRRYFDVRMQEIEQLIGVTAQALSETTKLTSVVIGPQTSQLKLKRVQLVKIADTTALIVFVMDTGVIRNMTVQIPQDITPEYLEALSQSLSKCVEDKTMQEAVNEIRTSFSLEKGENRRLLDTVIDTVSKSDSEVQERNIIFGGTENIFNHPEYRNIDKARDFLKLLEKKDNIYNMMSKATNMEFSIKIGAENDIDQLKDMSVVMATYKFGNSKIGSFGVIGPTRMNYGKIMSILSYVGSNISNILNYMIDDDDGLYLK